MKEQGLCSQALHPGTLCDRKTERIQWKQLHISASRPRETGTFQSRQGPSHHAVRKLKQHHGEEAWPPVNGQLEPTAPASLQAT